MEQEEVGKDRFSFQLILAKSFLERRVAIYKHFLQLWFRQRLRNVLTAEELSVVVLWLFAVSCQGQPVVTLFPSQNGNAGVTDLPIHGENTLTAHTASQLAPAWC
jgi:hypothetical protein